MTDARFGGSSAGLMQRLRPTRICVADLRDVADTLLPALATPRLRVDMVSRSGAGSVVVVEEDERQVRIGLARARRRHDPRRRRTDRRPGSPPPSPRGWPTAR